MEWPFCRWGYGPPTLQLVISTGTLSLRNVKNPFQNGDIDGPLFIWRYGTGLRYVSILTHEELQLAHFKFEMLNGPSMCGYSPFALGGMDLPIFTQTYQHEVFKLGIWPFPFLFGDIVPCGDDILSFAFLVDCGRQGSHQGIIPSLFTPRDTP